MDEIRINSENPCQDGASDVLIKALSRTIEIDLRAMLDENGLSEPEEPAANILM